jgi:hypothetical protein|tara:strand:+ start:226 stop:540 length:315 start_codon:yes stop_codon:yes gene_type:complete
MKQENRMMITLDPDTMATLKRLSEHTGLPMTAYAKLLIRSGMPAIEPLVLEIQKTGLSTKKVIEKVQEQLEILAAETDDALAIEEQFYWKNKEEQLELMESKNR